MLVFLATEHLLHERCKGQKIEVPNPDGSSRGSTRLTFECVRNLFDSECISVVAMDDNSVRLGEIDEIYQRIVQAMGEEWELMYDESHIKQVMTRYAVDKGWRL